MESLVRKEVNDAIDGLEAVLLENFEPIDAPLNHTFLPGMYVREIVMEAGSKVTSRIHKITHPYVILSGSANIWVDGVGWKLIKAPFFGITPAGTRRILKILERMHFITFHSNPDDTQDLDIIEERVIEKHVNPLLGGVVRLNKITKEIEDVQK